MKDFSTLASQESIEKVKQALESHGFVVVIKETGAEAKEYALSLIPDQAEVMNMTSATLTTLGIDNEILHSEKYHAIKNVLANMDRDTQKKEMKKLGEVPDIAIGSVQAVTEDGSLVTASASGSQLPAYVYGADKVIFVVGTQKIVSNLDEALKRINEYVLPLESKRVQKAYGMPHSSVNKILVLQKEPVAGRTTVILVKEALGY